MILGIGNDLIEIERIRKAIEEHKQSFLDRLFTPKEQRYCLKKKDPVPHFAGRFAAKEAIVKALGCGFGKEISWQDIEILGDEKGQPHVFFSAPIKEKFKDPKILITITHCREYASAVALFLSHS